MAGVLTINLVYQKARTDEVDRIRKLNVCGSSLQDVDVLRQVKNLEVLSLSVNDIEDIHALGELTNLKELYLRRNNIRDLSQVQFLSRLPHLQVLNLSDNPVARDPKYRRFVIATLPKLQQLDDINIAPEERRTAYQSFPEASSSDIGGSGATDDYDSFGNSNLGDGKSSFRMPGYGQKPKERSFRRVQTTDEGKKASLGTFSGRPLSREAGSSMPPTYHKDPGSGSQRFPYPAEERRRSSDPSRYIPKAAGRRGVGSPDTFVAASTPESPFNGGPSEAGVVQAIKVLCAELSPSGIRDVLHFVQSLDSY